MTSSWDNVAELRRKQIESNCDITFSSLFVPYFLNMISKYPHQNIFEIGCGTGHMAKAICENLSPCSYTAVEPSKGMYSIACDVNSQTKAIIINKSIFEYKDNCEYDIIFSHLCLHAIDDIEKLFSKVYNITKNKGIFIFSIPHPCFYNEHKNIFNDFKYTKIQKTYFSLSITNDHNKTSPIPYIHRPIEYYIKTLLLKKFHLIEFSEIFPKSEIMKLYRKKFDKPHYIAFICQK